MKKDEKREKRERKNDEYGREMGRGMKREMNEWRLGFEIGGWRPELQEGSGGDFSHLLL